MLCPECRRCQLVERSRTIQHTASGYLHVLLQNVLVGECPECGAEVVSPQAVAGLERLIEIRLAGDRTRHLTLAWQKGHWVEVETE